MSPPLFIIWILSPPLLKMCKPIATKKSPHTQPKPSSLNHAIGAMTSSQHAHRQSGTGWPSGGSGDFPNGRPAIILYLRPPPSPSTIAHCGGYMVIVPTTSKTKLTPLRLPLVTLHIHLELCHYSAKSAAMLLRQVSILSGPGTASLLQGNYTTEKVALRWRIIKKADTLMLKHQKVCAHVHACMHVYMHTLNNIIHVICLYLFNAIWMMR